MKDIFERVMEIAHKLVDAEALPGWDKAEQRKADDARAEALKCMRQLGKREFDKVGKADDWGT